MSFRNLCGRRDENCCQLVLLLSGCYFCRMRIWGSLKIMLQSYLSIRSTRKIIMDSQKRRWPTNVLLLCATTITRIFSFLATRGWKRRIGGENVSFYITLWTCLSVKVSVHCCIHAFTRIAELQVVRGKSISPVFIRRGLITISLLR
jgi:hypothetical protein